MRRSRGPDGEAQAGQPESRPLSCGSGSALEGKPGDTDRLDFGNVVLLDEIFHFEQYADVSHGFGFSSHIGPGFGTLTQVDQSPVELAADVLRVLAGGDSRTTFPHRLSRQTSLCVGRVQSPAVANVDAQAHPTARPLAGRKGTGREKRGQVGQVHLSDGGAGFG